MNESEKFARTDVRCTGINRECEDSSDLFSCATGFVDRTIVDAVNKLTKSENRELAIDNSCEGCQGCETIEANEWPTSEQMSVRAGLRCIKNMMRKWKNEPAMKGWRFYAEFIGLESNGSSDFYSYQVRWSVPTPAYPEPQVIVSVFFTIEAAKIKYPKCLVDVTYNFEGNQFRHHPRMLFRPKWIYDVLDMKTMIFKSFKF